MVSIKFPLQIDYGVETFRIEDHIVAERQDAIVSGNFIIVVRIIRVRISISTIIITIIRYSLNLIALNVINVVVPTITSLNESLEYISFPLPLPFLMLYSIYSIFIVIMINSEEDLLRFASRSQIQTCKHSLACFAVFPLDVIQQSRLGFRNREEYI